MNFILKWTIGLKAKKANKTVRHFSHCSLALFFPTKKALPKAMAALTFCLQWNPHTHTDIYTHMQRQSSPGWAALDGHTGLSCLCEDSSCSPWKEALHGGREVKKKADSLFLSLPPKFRALEVHRRESSIVSREMSPRCSTYTLHGCVKFTQTHTLSHNGFIIVNGPLKNG